MLTHPAWKPARAIEASVATRRQTPLSLFCVFLLGLLLASSPGTATGACSVPADCHDANARTTDACGSGGVFHHCHLDNGEPAPTGCCKTAGIPTIFCVTSAWDVTHDRGLMTALYAGKTCSSRSEIELVLSQAFDTDWGATT